MVAYPITKRAVPYVDEQIIPLQIVEHAISARRLDIKQKIVPT